MSFNKKKQYVPLNSVFKALYTSHAWKAQWELYQLSRNWKDIVGDIIGEISEPAFFRKDTLCIYVENSAWMQQLQFLKPELLLKVNMSAKSRALKDMRFILRPPEFGPKEEKREVAPEKEIAPERQQMFEEMTAGIDDDRCREALVNLWKDHQKKSR